MRALLCNLTLLLVIAIWIRVILSWFPLNPTGIPARINTALGVVTDPVLQPIRRILPSTGFIDLSPLIAALGIEIVVRQLLLGC
jgi:YggT family protein